MKLIYTGLLCLAVTLVAGFSATGPSAQDVAQPEPESKDAKEKKDAGAEADGASDAWALYRKKGRTWTIKNSTQAGQISHVSYTKYQITEVTDTYAMQQMTMLDKDRKPLGGMEPSESKIEFKTYKRESKRDMPKGDAPDQPENPDFKMDEETIEAAGQKWVCTTFEMEIAGMTTKTWTSKKYPGLTIKSETKGETAGMKISTTMELVEFNDEGQVEEKDDPAGEKGAADGKKGTEAAVDAYALYKK
jgi:hypothetical protein